MTHSPLKITQVATSDLGGGAERVALDLHKQALNHHISSTLAVGFKFLDISHSQLIDNDAFRSKWAQFWIQKAPGTPKPPQHLSRFAVAKRQLYKSIGEPSRAIRRARGYEDFSFPATLGVLENTLPDIVHLHNIHGGYFDLCALPELCSRVPVVITAHDQWLSTGHCAHPVDCSKNNLQQRCDVCPHLDYPPKLNRDGAHKNFETKCAIFNDPRTKFHLVGPARWITEKFENSLCAGAIIDSHVIPNGVDQTIFSPLSQEEKSELRHTLSLPQDDFVCIFSVASTTSPYKDSHTILEALSRLQQKGNLSQSITLLELGTPGESHETRGPISVRGVPFLSSPQDVARHLQASDLYIHAARAEVLPLAIIEAQSCGIPALITNTGGAPEAIIPEKTGRVVAQENPEELACALKDILDNKELLECWREATLLWARPRFSAVTMAEAYFALYEKILRDQE